MTNSDSEGPRPDVPALSASGRARREAMLGELEAALDARVRRRRIIRAGGLAILIGSAGVLALMAMPPSAPSSGGQPVAQGAGTSPAGLTMRYASLRVVETDQAILERNGEGGRIVQIDDERLLDGLRALGRPTGLIRTRGTVVLTADIGVKPEPPEGSPSSG